MKLTYLQDLNRARSFVDVFGGLNRRLSVSEGEFSDMENMSGDCYPLLSPRKTRTTVKKFEAGEKVYGYACKEAHIYVAEKNGVNQLFVNGEQITEIGDLLTGSAQRTIVGMGCYAVVFPDKYFVNLVNTSDKGSLENKVKKSGDFSSAPITLTPCTMDGKEYTNAQISDTEPSEKTSGTVWIDTSGENSIYKVWDEGTKQWSQVSAVYIKATCATLGKNFKKWDGISISGLAAPEDSEERVKKQVKALNAEGVIVFDAEENYIVFAGLLDSVVTISSGDVKFERKVPQLDYVIESGNRLWGCRYGVQNGKVVNEIYASKLGDFKNWNCFLGISTDSYAASLGSDGRFTGAISYLGYPMFFKERCIHRVYGNMPSNYQITTLECRGVARGNEKSLAIVNNILFYRSPIDFCAYDGALPESISSSLGEVQYKECVCGGVNNKLYVSALRTDETREMLVFDTVRGFWHRESGENISFFQKDGHVLYFLSKSAESAEGVEGVFEIKSVDDKYNTLIGNGTPSEEESFEWYADSGNIGFEDEYRKYISKVIIRAQIETGAQFELYVSYDDGAYRKVLSARSKSGIGSTFFPFKPVRCDHFKIRLKGTGNVRFISIAKVLETGSDRP